MAEPLDPIHLAHLLADLERRNYAERVRDHAEFADEAILPATYDSFDAESGVHLVGTLGGGIEPAVRSETNGGLRKGEPVEFVWGVVDAMPRPNEPVRRQEIKRSTQPKFAALVAKNAVVRVRTIFSSGSSEFRSPPVPAMFGIVYYDANRPPPAEWVGTAEEPRYTFGIERYWSGLPPTSNRLYNRNRERFCWTGQGNWQQAPRNFVRSSGYNYETLFGSNKLCYEWLVRSPFTPSGFDAGGGVILINRTAATDGVSQAPTGSGIPLPKIYYKIENPEFPSNGDLASFGEKWLGCGTDGTIPSDGGFGVAGGDPLTNLLYNWQPLEIFKYSDYVPETIIQEARPPSVIQVPDYEVQFWVFTNDELPKKLDFTTKISGSAFISLPSGSLVYESSSIAIDDQGSIHVSIKAGLSDSLGGLTKYFVDGEAIDVPDNWRGFWQKNFERNEDVPNSCHRDYQNFETINLNEDGDRLFQVSKELTIENVLQGSEFEIWAYDIVTDTTPPTIENETVCEVNLNRAPDLVEPITLGAPSAEVFNLDTTGQFKESARILTYATHIIE